MPKTQEKAVLVLGLETPDLGPVHMQGKDLGWYFKMKKRKTEHEPLIADS